MILNNSWWPNKKNRVEISELKIRFILIKRSSKNTLKYTLIR